MVISYRVVLRDKTEIKIQASDVDLQTGDDGRSAWFNFTDEDGVTVGAVPFDLIAYICD